MEAPNKTYLEKNLSFPDKIYIPQHNIEAGTIQELCELIVEGSVEYIRKDALIEVLEKVSAEYKKRSDEGELVWQNMCGINEAINIINEM